MNKTELKNAHATWDGQTLTVDSGLIRRTWHLTDAGLTTTELVHHASGATWVSAIDDKDTAARCDWYIYNLTPPGAKAELVDARLDAITNDPLTGEHIEAVLEFHYPETALAVRYHVRAYPDLPGLRTQLALRALKPFERDDLPSYIGGSYGESLALQPADCRRIVAGYYNDPQHRNRDDAPILRRQTCEGALGEANGQRETWDWATLLGLERGEHGLTLLKESNKCVNQDGIDGGAFTLEIDRLCVTGLGMTPYLHSAAVGGGPWLRHDRFRNTWATWCLLHPADESARQLAVKQFDRQRFCPDPTRDLQSRANTWGTRDPAIGARSAATEDNVLREIEACADLGIDAIAIDDGWQTGDDGTHPPDTDWRPHPDRYPQGWGPVVEAAKQAGVALDLWIPAGADLQHIIRNRDEAGFGVFKLDWFSMGHRDAMDNLLDKAHYLLKQTDYRARVSWDVTENPSRLGYYVGREFGSLHTSNRRCSPDRDRTRHVVYVPRLVLRDCWHLAHYLNLNQIEVPVQNVDLIDARDGNAGEHPHDYIAAIALMGLPLFFQEVQRYTEPARKQLRPVMQRWRAHRAAMASGYVFPIGDEPCDAAWCGFQSAHPDAHTGYLTVLRELHAPESQRSIPLHFLDAGTQLTLTDVMTDEQTTARLDDDGALPLEIANPAGFRWLRYEVSR